MDSEKNIVLLKEILENLTDPERLDNHPWVTKGFVLDACRKNPDIQKQSPGHQLAEAVTGLFLKIQPAMPPKRGIRLDSRWGEFGLLASQYFAPHKFGLPKPATLREAWTNIDNAIILFVFGQDVAITNTDRERFQLVSGEPEIAANSTISDWHRKGIEHLAGVIIHYENTLVAKEEQSKQVKTQKNLVWQKSKRWFSIIILVLPSIMIIWLGFRGWSIYQRVRSVESKSQELIALSKSINTAEQLQEAGRTISVLRSDLEFLQKDTVVYQEISPMSAWIPRYGGTLSQAPALLEMATQLSIAGDEAFQVIRPAISSSEITTEINVMNLLGDINNGSSRLLAAQVALARAKTARQQIETNQLIPRLQILIEENVDPLFLSMQGSFPVDDLFAMARLAPRLLGAIGNGPQNYLIMVQNEDEMRPTGGFFSAVGLLVMENGEIQSLSFESTDLTDDFSKPYPQAPWQLDKYMMAEMLLLRDANWFTDFPTSVKWVRFLYAYSHPQTINGVITLDQHVLVELLDNVGPLLIEGETVPISAENVTQYMRTAKELMPPEGVSKQEWDRKQFISRLAEPLLRKISIVDSTSLENLVNILIQLLDEKHILIDVDDPEMNELLARRGWNGAIQLPTNSDFLMSVESNVGINKTNAVIQISQKYSVDLSNLNQPVAQYTIRHTNSANSPGECIQARLTNETETGERQYRINDCYWSYLRIYTPAGTIMVSSTPHEIPSAWPLREQAVPARTDILDEKIPGIQAYGTLLVVPGNQTLETNFTYQLPLTVITRSPEQSTSTYRLMVQKQPGTMAIPLIVHLRLPTGYTLKSNESTWQNTSNGWEMSTTLEKDRYFDVEFGPSSE